MVKLKLENRTIETNWKKAFIIINNEIFPDSQIDFNNDLGEAIYQDGKREMKACMNYREVK